jgi:hypothetical protein
MSWSISQRVGVLFLLLVALTQGCSTARPASTARIHDINDPPRATALFAANRSTNLATQIGRGDWPATDGAIESPQETVFYEYYRDFQSDARSEEFSPYRTFTSVRVGAQQR